MKKYAVIDLELCDPKKCNPDKGICMAIKPCKHNIIVQEEPFEPPQIISQSMCVGCADCAGACPFKAIKISRGAYSG
jgi:ATP-binding cassette subfamily E protein 1